MYLCVCVSGLACVQILCKACLVNLAQTDDFVVDVHDFSKWNEVDHHIAPGSLLMFIDRMAIVPNRVSVCKYIMFQF